MTHRSSLRVTKRDPEGTASPHWQTDSLVSIIVGFCSCVAAPNLPLWFLVSYNFNSGG